MTPPAFQPTLTSIFARAWSLSWQAALLIVMVLLTQWLARRWLPARWRYNLWLLVLVRLVLPFSPESPLSIFNAVRSVPKSIQTAPLIYSVARPSTGKVVPSVSAPLTSVTLVPLPATRTVPVAALLTGGPQVRSVPPQTQRVISTDPFAAFPATAERINWWALAAWTWLAGAGAFAVYVGWTTRRALRQFRAATLLSDPQITALLDRCRQKMRVRTLVTIHESTAVKSPALVGVIRPQLLLPPGLLNRFSLTELRYVFLHELAHVRRRDLALNWLLALLQIVHWFNPVIWWGFARMRADREIACDALAMACSDEAEAKSYGQTLIKLLEGFTRPTVSPGLVGILEGKHQMARRLRLIASFRRHSHWSWVAAALMAALAVTGLTDAVRPSHAQIISPSKTSDAKKVVHLTVLDAQTGQPVPDANVITGYSWRVSYSTRPPMLHTNANGVAVFPADAVGGGLGFGVFSDGYAPRVVESVWYSELPKPVFPEKYTVRLERGMRIGGIVRDEQGQSLVGVRVSVRASIDPYPRDGAERKPILEYPIFDPLFTPRVVTDAEGRWTCAHVPPGMKILQLDFERQDGSFRRFHTPQPKWDTGAGGDAVDTSTVWEGEFACVLKRRTDVHGVVVDPAGHPLAGVQVEETDGRHKQGPVSLSTTGVDGQFLLPNRDPHQILLTLTGSGFAPHLEVVNVTPSLPELPLTMHPAATLRLRVTDNDGYPISGTKIVSSEPTLHWENQTDADGRMVWDGAPLEPSLYQLAAEGYGPRSLSFAATDSEQRVVLRKGDPMGTLVTIRANDETGRPLDTFTVTAAYQTPGGVMDVYDRLEPLGAGKEGRCTVLIPLGKSNQSDFRLKIEADNRQPFTSEPLLGIMCDREVTAVLPRAELTGPEHPQIVLRLPGGAPAASASVILHDPSTGNSGYLSLYFFGRGRPRAEGNPKKTVTVDNNGGVLLPVGASDATVIVLHEQGYLFTTLGELRRTAETTLAPWGRLEGTLTLNGQPKFNQRVMLQPHYRSGVRKLSYDIELNTDRNGHFVFDRVPADDYRLSCSQVSSGEWPLGHPTLVRVNSGQTTQVPYQVTGRSITGSFRINPADAVIDWKKDLGDCLLSRQPSGREDVSTPRPAYDDYVRAEDYRRADKEFLSTHRYASGNDLRDSYAPEIDVNGNFRFEGVPPGNYELRLQLRRSQVSNNERHDDPLGELKRIVVVPDAPLEHPDAPVVLGETEITVNATLLPKRETVAFTARGLDGQIVNLANYRGRAVLLLFWASWGPPPAQLLVDWQDVARAHRADERLVVLSVSLDDDPNAATQFARENGLPGTQVRLEDGAKTTVTESLAINELPATLLLGPDGRIVARDLSGAHLRAAIDAVSSSR